ncbi:MAG TPA: hypothetical protein PK609_02415 [Candidatus Paceibacterota bacterium]|nr:hypothetical protein [Candidatus Paceibacterota bacterium]
MDIWKHGTYFDLWSLVHFLSGALLATAAVAVGFSFVQALVYTSLILVAWEAYEWLLGILEAPANVTSDLVLGLVGFLGVAYLHYELRQPINLFMVAALGTLLVLLSGWGFRDLFVRGYR